MGREGESVHEDPQAGGWAPAREGGAPCEQACHCLSSIPWPWRVEEGDEPTQIHDSRSVFAQGGSRCPVPTPCSASCLRCVYVWRNVAMWDPCTSLLDSLPAVTLEEFPSLTLHCSTMKRKWQQYLPARGFERKMHSAWHRVGPLRPFPSLRRVGMFSTKTRATLSALNSFGTCCLYVFRSCPFGFGPSSETTLFTLKTWQPFREDWSHPEGLMEEKQLYQRLKEGVGVGEAEAWTTPVESQGWECQRTALS